MNEVITTGGAGGLGSSPIVTSSSSSSTSSSVPELTVQEHVNTQPITTATSEASVTPIDTHPDVTEEVSQPEGPSDVITETFPGNAASSPSTEVNETFKKSDTPPTPEKPDDGPSEGESGSGELDGIDEQRDIVYDAAYRR